MPLSRPERSSSSSGADGIRRSPEPVRFRPWARASLNSIGRGASRSGHRGGFLWGLGLRALYTSPAPGVADLLSPALEAAGRTGEPSTVPFDLPSRIFGPSVGWRTRHGRSRTGSLDRRETPGANPDRQIPPTRTTPTPRPASASRSIRVSGGSSRRAAPVAIRQKHGWNVGRFAIPCAPFPLMRVRERGEHLSGPRKASPGRPNHPP